MIRRLFVLLMVIGACSQRADGADPTGKVVFDLKPYTADFDVGNIIAREAEQTGLEWGFMPGLPNQLLVSGIPFVNWHVPNLPYTSSYGTQRELELPAGDYTLTCLWLSPAVHLFPVRGVLQSSAYVNEDVLHFAVRAGETTVLEARTVLRAMDKGLVKLIYRDIAVTVLEHGGAVAEAAINARTEKSVPWRDYTGPMKLRQK